MKMEQIRDCSHLRKRTHRHAFLVICYHQGGGMIYHDLFPLRTARLQAHHSLKQEGRSHKTIAMLRSCGRILSYIRVGECGLEGGGSSLQPLTRITLVHSWKLRKITRVPCK